MHKMLVRGLLLLALAGLNGCASMSGDECMATDWRTVGYEDGMRGYSGDRIGNYRKACAKHGVTPDLDAYQAGRAEGLMEYCQPSRGFSVGSAGGRYHGVCQVDKEADFLDAYNVGYHLYTLRSNVNQASSSIASKERELKRINDQIDAKEAALISDETTADQRVVLLMDLKNLAERTGELETEIRMLIEQRAYYQTELDNYQVVVADLGYY